MYQSRPKVKTSRRSIRRTQLISPWGVGQIINFPEDEALMVAGLDAWEQEFEKAVDKREFLIQEERLQKRLNVAGFRTPPDFRESGEGVINPNLHIPFVRFPRWHYCQYCGNMKEVSSYSSHKVRCDGYKFTKGRSCADKPDNKRPFLIPFRFITICPKGHIEDFPFYKWVHHKKEATPQCRLQYLVSRRSSSLSALQIWCTCGEMRTMANSFTQGVLKNIKKCGGERPWLGEYGKYAKGCGEDLQTVQRGGSNVYFPLTFSSIYLPTGDVGEDKTIIELVNEYWARLGTLKDGQLRKEYIYGFAESKGVDPDKLYSAALKKHLSQSSGDQENFTESEEVFRQSEYEALITESNKNYTDFYLTNYKASNYLGAVSAYLTSVSLVHKLRETRALAGFSRLLPEDGKSIEQHKGELFKSTGINWLPAVIVRGEGVFLEFKSDLLEKWENRDSVRKRTDILISNYNKMRDAFKLPFRKINSRFVLLHTFSHILINQLSYQCGYGSSSLKERIYCNTEEDQIMNGILIYTASGDAEGSLGGLVRQGKQGNLENIVSLALQSIEWCSSDPICIQSPGQGPGSCNLAACHNCALLPETSCEESNRLLDRGLLIGTISDKSLGFFR